MYGQLIPSMMDTSQIQIKIIYTIRLIVPVIYQIVLSGIVVLLAISQLMMRELMLQIIKLEKIQL